MPVQAVKTTIVQGFRTWALPRLTELPDAQWDEAIRKAQTIEFDGVERIALIVGVVAVTYLLRIEAGTAPAISLPVIYLVQLIEAVLLLILFVGPFYLRRARRGLDFFIANYDMERKPKP
jgi:hypothetical protein